MLKLNKALFALNEVKQLLAVPLSFRINTPLTSPTLANIFLTSRCDSRCIMCDFWKPETTQPRELSTNEWFSVFSQIKELGIKMVSVSAEGEVLMRRDIFKLLGRLGKLGIPYSVNTNLLSASPERAKRLVDCGVTSIMTSIDSATPSGYHRIRGIKNGLHKVLKAIENIKKTGLENISIGSVCMIENVDELANIAELGRSIGISGVRYTAMQQQGFAKDRNPEVTKRYRNPQFLAELSNQIEQIIEFKKKYGIINNTDVYLRGIPESYVSNHYLPIPCIQGYYRIKILQDGAVSICPIMGNRAVLGNVREQSIMNLWYSKRAGDIRKMIFKGMCPTCWLSCYIEDNLRFSLNHAVSANFNLLKRATRA